MVSFVTNFGVFMSLFDYIIGFGKLGQLWRSRWDIRTIGASRSVLEHQDHK